MPEARRAQSPCCIRRSVGVDDDLQVWLGVLGRVGKGGEPIVSGSSVAVRDGYEVDVWMRWRDCTEVKEGLLGDCTG
jgi:hypothetical protein